MNFTEQLMGPMGGMFAFGAAIGGSGMFTLFRMGLISTKSGVEQSKALAKALTRIELLEKAALETKEELDKWRAFKEQAADAALAKRTL